MYHGSKNLFGQFLPPAETGNMASGEGERRQTGYARIYVSMAESTAMEYAVRGDGAGYLYEVAIDGDAPTLGELRAASGAGAKNKAFQLETICPLPEQIKIRRVWRVTKRRGQSVAKMEV